MSDKKPKPYRPPLRIFLEEEKQHNRIAAEQKKADLVKQVREALKKHPRKDPDA